jgi:UDP-N-acetylmuramate dehydrogenase
MHWFACLDEKIAEYLPDLPVEKDEPLAKHTSFRIGGPARRMAFPRTGEQLVLLMSFAAACGADPLVIGNGTNLLVADEGLDRLVINTRDLAHMEIDEEKHEVCAGAGVPLVKLANFACRYGLTGLEFAHGIPGSVGGAVCMNAGAYGGEMKQVITEVTVLFPEEGVRRLTAEEMDFSYRHSLLSDHPEAVVLSARFRLTPGDEGEIRAKMEELMARRKASQPLEWPSAGSTFKRPAGYYAGMLIEQSGLKGTAVGGARVSEKHAGFVINTGGATCADVMELIARVQDTVYREHGVRLEPEVRIIR